MKYYKSFILLGMFALSFASCNTDDLERNIDELTTRVEDMEKQVQALNDNMNVIRVLLDGNKTIQSYTYDEATGTYTLVLSDGQTMTLTQGNDDNITYPQVTVGDNGNWFVDGVDTGQRAKAQDGTPVTVTPQFQIVTEGTDKVWQVSYDEGATWDYVTDETGAHVKATGTVSGTNPIEAVKVENGCLSVTVDGTEYTIPIVEGLVCQIVEPENVENDTWYVAKGGDGTDLTVNVNLESGDIVRAVAPADWTVTVPDYSALTGEQALTLSVRAPETPSECVLSVEVTRGVHTAASEIKVHTTTDSYYADFMAGLDVQAGNVKINKYMFDGEEIHVLSSDQSITEPGGVYFIRSGVNVSYDNTGDNAATLVLIGDNPTDKPELKVNRQLRVAETSGNEGKGLFFCYNLKIDATEVYNTGTSPSLSYLLAQNGNTAFKNAVFGNCEIELSTTQQPLTYISSSNRSYENFVLENCKIKYPEGKTDQRFIISVGSSTATYGTLTFRNNVFYCATDGNLISNFKLFNGSSATINKLVLQNNTFVNTGSATTSYVYASTVQDAQVSNNLFFADNGSINNYYIVFRTTNAIPGSLCQDNVGYRSDATSQGWRMFYQSGGVSCGWDGAEDIEQISANPFDGGTFDPANGVFIPDDAYADYGSTMR